MAATVPLAADIVRRIEADFGPGSLDGIAALLAPAVEAGLGDRVLRCVIALARGETGRLRHNVEQALKDYRDVIYWAEYDASGRIRDYDRPFLPAETERAGPEPARAPGRRRRL